jgi:hypothetical protein
VPSYKVISIDEVSEVLTELVVSVKVVAVNSRLFDCAVQAFNLAIGPRMLDRGQACGQCCGWRNHSGKHGT